MYYYHNTKRSWSKHFFLGQRYFQIKNLAVFYHFCRSKKNTILNPNVFIDFPYRLVICYLIFHGGSLSHMQGLELQYHTITMSQPKGNSNCIPFPGYHMIYSIYSHREINIIYYFFLNTIYAGLTTGTVTSMHGICGRNYYVPIDQWHAHVQ